MKDYEKKNFYQEDEHKYILKNNKEFNSLLSMLEKKGYKHPEIEKIQKYIETTRLWYEFKYPELEFEIDEGYRSKDAGIKKLSKNMTTEQLLVRVDNEVAYLLHGFYKSRGWGLCKRKDSEGNIYTSYEMFMTIKPKTKYSFGTLYNIDHKDGSIIDSPFLFNKNKYSGKTIDQIVEELDESKSNLDYSELSSSVFTHNCDLYIREEIIKLAALRIMYSENTNPIRGYIRANRYIKESNRDLGTNVSLNEINNIITKDYNYCRPKEVLPIDQQEIKNKNEEVVKRILKKR